MLSMNSCELGFLLEFLSTVIRVRALPVMAVVTKSQERAVKGRP